MEKNSLNDETVSEFSSWMMAGKYLNSLNSVHVAAQKQIIICLSVKEIKLFTHSSPYQISSVHINFIDTLDHHNAELSM